MGNAEHKIAKVMGEFKEGELRSGSGKKVTDKDQAIAIALSMARKNRKRVNRPLKEAVVFGVPFGGRTFENHHDFVVPMANQVKELSTKTLRMTSQDQLDTLHRHVDKLTKYWLDNVQNPREHTTHTDYMNHYLSGMLQTIHRRNATLDQTTLGAHYNAFLKNHALPVDEMHDIAFNAGKFDAFDTLYGYNPEKPSAYKDVRFLNHIDHIREAMDEEDFEPANDNQTAKMFDLTSAIAARKLKRDRERNIELEYQRQARDAQKKHEKLPEQTPVGPTAQERFDKRTFFQHAKLLEPRDVELYTKGLNYVISNMHDIHPAHEQMVKDWLEDKRTIDSGHYEGVHGITDLAYLHGYIQNAHPQFLATPLHHEISDHINGHPKMVDAVSYLVNGRREALYKNREFVDHDE